MGQAGNRVHRILQIQRIEHVVDIGIVWAVTFGQRWDIPSPLNQFEDRRVIVDLVVDSRTVRIPQSKWRRNYGRYSATQKGFAVGQIGIDVVGRNCAWWRNMLEEPTPLVEGNDHHRGIPVRTFCDRLEGLRQEGIATVNVIMRMVVGSKIDVEDGERRIHVRNRGQRSVLRVGKELTVGFRNTQILDAPQTQERNIRKWPSYTGSTFTREHGGIIK